MGLALDWGHFWPGLSWDVEGALPLVGGQRARLQDIKVSKNNFAGFRLTFENCIFELTGYFIL